MQMGSMDDLGDDVVNTVHRLRSFLVSPPSNIDTSTDESVQIEPGLSLNK